MGPFAVVAAAIAMPLFAWGMKCDGPEGSCPAGALSQEALQEEEASLLQLSGPELPVTLAPSSRCGAGGECQAGGCCYNPNYSDHYICAAAGDFCCFSQGQVWPVAERDQCIGEWVEPAGSRRQPPLLECGAGQCGKGNGCCYNRLLSDHYACAARGDRCCYKNKEVYPVASCSSCSGKCLSSNVTIG